MNKLLSVQETAESLRLAKITVYKMVSAKQIPFMKIGRRVLFDPSQLKEWLDDKTVSPLTN